MRFYFLLLCSLSISIGGYTQAGCPAIDAGPDIDLDCGDQCVDVSATVFETGNTETYSVNSIPYAPVSSFTGGVSLFVGSDDIFSTTINLPFNFCFFGNSFNQLVVGANGLISFDITNSGGYCEYSFSASIPDPVLYTNSIMGAYHDIDPSASIDPDINYKIFGTPPCRQFVINFADVAHYDCNDIETTQQIVLYETTNVIEVYIKDKPTCTSWNDGNAVIGIQNEDGTIGYTPPGRNTGDWSTSNEAWRFTPDGPDNFTVNWYEGGALVATGLDVTLCPTTSPANYTAEVVYTQCDGSTITETDQLQILGVSDMTVAPIVQDALCVGVEDGSIAFNVTGGTPPLIYSVDGGSTFYPTFAFLNLPSGPYSLVVKDDAGCEITESVIIGTVNTFDISATNDPVTCNGSVDGAVNITVNTGTPPYSYSIDNGNTFWTNGSFTDLIPGLYPVVVKDDLGCIAKSLQIVKDPPPLTLDITPERCYTKDTLAQLYANASGGLGDYTYVWDGFSNDAPDLVVVTDVNKVINLTVVDGNGCVKTTSTKINIKPEVDFEADVLEACVPASIEFTNKGSANNNSFSCLWYINDGSEVFDNCEGKFFHTFTNAGTYDVGLAIQDANGCSAQDTHKAYIRVLPIPKADFYYRPQTEITTLNNEVRFFSTAKQEDYIEWYLDDILIETDDRFIHAFPFETSGDYIMCQRAVLSPLECADTICKSIHVKEVTTVYVPNSFTPNGDDINDFFFPKMVGVLEEGYSFQIFDRWGNIIFETSDITEKWDGTDRGKEVKQGVYSWKLITKHVEDFGFYAYNGEVVLIR